MSDNEEQPASMTQNMRDAIREAMASQGSDGPLGVGERLIRMVFTETGMLGLIVVVLLGGLVWAMLTVGKGTLGDHEEMSAGITGLIHQNEKLDERVEDVERELRDLQRSLQFRQMAPFRVPQRGRDDDPS